jgi:hypothetical protein
MKIFMVSINLYKCFFFTFHSRCFFDYIILNIIQCQNKNNLKLNKEKIPLNESQLSFTISIGIISCFRAHFYSLFSMSRKQILNNLRKNRKKFSLLTETFECFKQMCNNTFSFLIYFLYNTFFYYYYFF